MGVMEIAVRADDQASEVLERIGETGGKAANFLEENWGKVAVAGGIAGAAMEGFARKQAPLREQTRKLAAALGVSEDSMRDLALETSNVTFPLEEVLDLFELGRQQGMKTGEELQRFATFWDTVGDATGESAVELGKAGIGLRAVGIAAGDESKALAAFGFISQETTSSVSEFLRFLERTGPELRGMGMDVNDAAAVMGVLESEMGMAGRVARTEFRKAVSEADGDLGLMLETLGVSTDQFDKYRGKVDESSDVIERNAQIHAESYTPIQRLQHAAEELMFKYGALGEIAGMVALPLMALGPVMKGVATIFTSSIAKKMAAMAAAAAQTVAHVGVMIARWVLLGAQSLIHAAKVAAAWLIAMGPVGLVIAAVTGLVALIIANWETVKEWTAKIWDAIWSYLQWLWDTIISKIPVVALVRLIVDNWERIRDRTVAIFNAIRDFFAKVWNAITSTVRSAISFVTDRITGAWNAVRNITSAVWNAVSGTISGVWDGIKSTVGAAVSWVRERISNAWDAITGAARGFVRTLGNIIDRVKGVFAAPINWVIRNVINRFLSGIQRVANAININIDLPRIPEVSVMHRGGIVGEATGARRDPTGLTADETLILAKRGEGVLPEDVMAQLGREGFERLLSGEPLETHLEEGGILSGVWGAVKSVTAMVARAVRRLIATIVRPMINAAIGAIDRMGGLFGQPGRLLGGGARMLGEGVLDWIAGVEEGMPADVLDASAFAHPFQALTNFIKESGVPHRVTSTLRSWPKGSFHTMGRAADFAGPVPSILSAALDKIFWAFEAVFDQLAELIYAGAPFNIKHGAKVGRYAIEAHKDHVHAALEGGALFTRPTRGTFAFAEREPEIVSPEAMLRRIVREEAGPSTVIWINDLILDNVPQEVSEFFASIRQVARQRPGSARA